MPVYPCPEDRDFFMIDKSQTEKMMVHALRLAAKGIGYTSPNPVVGCIITKNNNIIARDYHHKVGQPHAEVLALKKAGSTAKGAEMYVTLEPCCCYGRTPPCTKAIIEASIKMIVIGTLDPNPDVNGKGVSELQKAGIEVITGVLKERCLYINKMYNKYITTGLPFVTLKFAQSLDGRIASKSGSSQWISSENSLKFAHKLRAEHDAVLIGSNTANLDNPQLTVRRVKGNNPIRIILTKSGRILSSLDLLSDNSAPVIIATGRKGSSNCKSKSYANVEIMTLPVKSDGLDLKSLLCKLAERGVVSLLIEGGAGVITSFLKQKLTDRIIVITAPIIIGKGISGIGDLGIKNINQSISLSNLKHKKIGSDHVYFGDLK